MKDEDKPKKQLINELLELRRRIGGLEVTQTKWMCAEEAVKSSEERYGNLFDGVPVGLYQTTPTGQILDANPALVQMLGYPDREALLGANVADGYVDPGERKRWQALIEREGVVPGYETQWYRRDGTTIWVREHARAVRDAKGHVLYYEGAVEDMTERKRADEMLRRYAEQLEALGEVGLELTAQLDLDTLLHSIVSRAIELTGGSGGGLFLHRPERSVLERVVSIGLDLVPVGTVLRRGEGLSGKVWEIGEPLIVDDYQRWEGRAVIYEGFPSMGIVGVPIRWNEEFMGVLNVLAEVPRIFSPADAEPLSHFAIQAAIAIKNAQLFSDREQRARELEALYKTSLDLMSLADPSELLEAIIRQAAELLDAKAGALFVCEPVANELELAVSYKLGKDYRGLRYKLGEGVSGKVAQSGEPLLVGDYSRWEGRSDKVVGEHSVACLGVPLKRGGKLLGVLVVDGKGINAFDERDVRLATLFASQAAIAIENARLYEGARKRIDQLFDLLMSHELRGPLTNIKIAAQTWDSLVSSSEIPPRELVSIIQQETDRLTWFLDRILRIAALETGLATPEWREVSLRSLLAKAVDPSWLPKHDHSLEVVVEDDLIVRADEGWIVIAIRNLLENAIKHCPPKSHIEVRVLKMDEEWAKVTVADNGEGIAARDLQHLFQKHYRGQNAVDRGTAGHGLGLYLVRLLVEAQGGTVWVDSEEGEGTIFGFSLPLIH